jgi:ABC-2 type transport system permease protein
MLRLITIVAKELLLLKRDRSGLLVLFLMPALLVVVITLVQENVMELTGQKKIQVLFLDLDKGYLGVSLRQFLETGNIEIVSWGGQENVEDIQAAVADGDYQVGVVIPEGSSVKMQEETEHFFKKTNSSKKENLRRKFPYMFFLTLELCPLFVPL